MTNSPSGFLPTSRAAEQARVDTVRARIHHRLDAVAAELERAEAETHRIERAYGDATRVNITEVDDRMETNAAVQQQKMLVARAVENEQILGREAKVLKRLEPAPHFGRIDIVDGDNQESLYIGTGSLQDEDGEFLVYDWRAPIAGVYYNGVVGPVTYDTPDGKRTVSLERKRQFRIEDGQITNLFDASETIGDAMLQDVLGQQSSDQLQNIVATIQREQNTIIRDTTSQLLIVQGAAGSGKTAAILQRAAYLLYHDRQTLTGDQLLMFSPNRLFATYIAAVLPSLGEKNLIQTTLTDFLSKRLTGLEVQTLFDRYERDQAGLPAAAAAIRREKEGAAFMTALAAYAKSAPALCFIDIELDGRTFFSKETMAKLYAQQPVAMAAADKFAAVRKTLMRRLNLRIKMAASEDWVDARLAELSPGEVRQYLAGRVPRDDQEEMALVARAVVAEKFAPVYSALYDDYFLDVYAQYRDFLDQHQQDAVTPAVWAEMATAYSADIERHELKLADAAPILYLRDLLTGSGQNHAVKALFIDEMQDYAPAMVVYVHHAFPNAQLTLLGDRAQDVFGAPSGGAHTAAAIQAALPQLRSRVVALNRAYRSSRPITDFATGLLPADTHIEAFARDGATPKLVAAAKGELLPALVRCATDLRSRHGRVAIITTTAKEAAGLQVQLENAAPELHPRLLDADAIEVGGGLIIMPVYLAKGLEFDAVIGWQVDDAHYGENGAAALYTVATRALHELVLLTSQVPKLLQGSLTSGRLSE